jgi:hypothetical protein
MNRAIIPDCGASGFEDCTPEISDGDRLVFDSLSGVLLLDAQRVAASGKADDSLMTLVRHDPMAIIGLLLIGTSGVLFFHVLCKTTMVGHHLPSNFFEFKGIIWTVPLAYLRARSRQGWSAWPAYLIWPFGLAGSVLLVLGLFRL